MSKDAIDLLSDEHLAELDREAAPDGLSRELETPVLLLAMPQVTSQPFHKSVVLLLRHDAEEGSLGFIVNQPTDLKVADILEDLEIPWNGDQNLPAYLGGPVNKERGTLVYTDDDLLGDESDLPGIAVSQSLGQLQELAEKPPTPFRLYLGYAGWGDGQLEEEILRNDWLIAPFDPDFLFSDDPEEVWYRAIRSVGIDPSQLPALDVARGVGRGELGGELEGIRHDGETTEDSRRPPVAAPESARATVRRLARDGWSVLAGARRIDKLREVCEPVGAAAVELDVTDEDSVAAFVRKADQLGFGELNLLVNNAGAALGVEPVVSGDKDLWSRMYELNVMGVLRLNQAFIGRLRASGDGHIIHLGSVAGFETYPGGGGYTASKHAVRAMTKTLRVELLGEPIRVTEVAPGLVETEFSVVRFDGDRDRADSVYRGIEPLVADDIADCIAWAASRPSHVNIDEIVVRPRAQATATAVHRENE